MQKEEWTVDTLRDDGWCLLRRDIYIYLVPRHVLPDGVSEGDVVHTYGATGDDYGRWTVERKQAG